jgi:hypothetical protein
MLVEEILPVSKSLPENQNLLAIIRLFLFCVKIFIENQLVVKVP